MRKIIFFLVLIIVILAVPAFFKFANGLAYNVSLKAAQAITNKKDIQGIYIEHIRFEQARFQPVKCMTWQNITAQIHLKKENAFLPGKDVTLHVNHLEIRLKRFFDEEFVVTANGITANPTLHGNTSENGMDLDRNGMKDGKLEMHLHLNYFKPGTLNTQIKKILHNLTEMTREGQSAIPIHFSCTSYFTFNGNPVRAMITTRKNAQGNYHLVVNQELFKSMAWLLADDLTDAEATLISHHPFRVPTLLRIMNDARTESERYKNVKAVPEDAYRHVLWSYLLTREYGPEFAKKITDAHEEGDDTNAEAEHQMDYNNNTVGRQYAAAGYKRSEVLEYLLQDPKVIREAR